MAQLDQKYFPALDGLRTLCVALVIFTHVKRTGLLAQIPAWVGVDIFFIISGFLITTLLLREERSNERIDLKGFYARRFFRIVPLYATLLAFYIVQARLNPERWQLELHSLPYQLTFMNDLLAVHIDKYGSATQPAVFGATWSLGIEEKFYLLWPAIFFLLPDRRVRPWIIPALLLVSALLPFRMFRSYFGLLVGCSVALLLAGNLASNIFRNARKLLERLPAGVALLLATACLPLVQHNESYIFLFSTCAGLLIATLMLRDGWTTGSSAATGWSGLAGGPIRCTWCRPSR